MTNSHDIYAIKIAIIGVLSIRCGVFDVIIGLMIPLYLVIYVLRHVHYKDIT